jgi:hypothetical protein
MEENKKKGSSLAFFRIFFLFLESKMRPKNQKMKPQKRYLEVSNSIREEVRAFFGLPPNGKIENFSKGAKKSALKFYVA